MHLFYLFLISGLIMACSSTPRPKWDPNRFNGKNVVIFVPGYYGTALAETDTGDRRHLTLGQALWGGRALALNHRELAIEDGIDVRPDGLLRKITIMPLLFSLDIYDGAIDFLEETCEARCELVSFPYDWRRSDVEAAQKLDILVDKIRKANAKKIHILAHSNGGLVVAYFLRYGNQPLATAKENWAGAGKVDGVLTAGTPYRGLPIAFTNMQFGVKFFLASTPLNSMVMASFESAYELLPADQKVFLNSQKKPFKRNIYDTELWDSKNWSLLKQTENQTDAIRDKRKRYTKKYLSLGQTFSKLILAPIKRAPKVKIPMVTLIATGEPTLTRLMWSQPTLSVKGSWIMDQEHLFDDGDGTVSVTTAQPPAAWKDAFDLTVARFEGPHRTLYNESFVQQKVKDLLP